VEARKKQIEDVNTHQLIATKQKVIRVLFIFIFGVTMGFISKYADTVGISVDGHIVLMIYQYSVDFIKDITSKIGLWIFIATIIAVWSRSPRSAAIHVFVFFVGMLLAYYSYSTYLFGFVPKYYVYRWGLISFLSLIGAYIVWHADGKGWLSACCAAPPIALLLTIGYSFFYTQLLLQGIDLIFSLILFVLLAVNNLQRLRILFVVVVLFLLIEKLNLISLFFGGL